MNPHTTPAARDIAAYKRLLLTGFAARMGLCLIFVIGVFLTTFKLAGELTGSLMMALAGVTYMYFTWRSMKLSREAASATDHLARGEIEDAERVLKNSIRAFSIYPAQRVVELYHLAVLRQGQARHAEAAEFASAVLEVRHPPVIGTGAALILLETRLELGDLRGAHAVLQRLGTPGGTRGTGRLDLSEQVRLLGSRSRYEMLTGAWEHLLWGLPDKLRLAELMSSEGYAMVHAWWAQAARKLGRNELGRWLLARSISVGGETGPAASIPDLADWVREEIATSPASGSAQTSSLG